MRFRRSEKPVLSPPKGSTATLPFETFEIRENAEAIESVACFPRYDSTNAAARTVNVAAAAWNQVNVDVRHGLPRRFAVIHPDIETGNRAVLVFDVRLHLVQQGENCVSLPTMEVKETFNVPLWDDKRVKRRHGVSVAYRVSETIGS